MDWEELMGYLRRNKRRIAELESENARLQSLLKGLIEKVNAAIEKKS